MDRRTADLVIVSGAGVVIVALTAAAFWLSYAHLAEIAMEHGLTGARAWAWPGCLDAFVVAGELLMLRAALQRRTDWWAIALTVVGSGGSIALNVVGVGGGATALDYVVAGVPPTAALLAFGALMRQVHRWLAHIPATPTAVRSDELVICDGGGLGVPPLPRKPRKPQKPAGQAKPRRSDDELLAKARETTADWPVRRITADALRAAMRVGPPRARALRDALRAERAKDPLPDSEPIGAVS
ncbi:DUF2637 domain-containing protein [Streptomyces mayteni]